MSTKDFKDLKKVFLTAASVVKNDEQLSEWLMELGANLVKLGESRRKRSKGRPT
jgi:hypothetical protein